MDNLSACPEGVIAMTYPRYLYDNEEETHRSEQTNPANLLAPLPYDLKEDFEEENFGELKW